MMGPRMVKTNKSIMDIYGLCMVFIWFSMFSMVYGSGWCFGTPFFWNSTGISSSQQFRTHVIFIGVVWPSPRWECRKCSKRWDMRTSFWFQLEGEQPMLSPRYPLVLMFWQWKFPRLYPFFGLDSHQNLHLKRSFHCHVWLLEGISDNLISFQKEMGAKWVSDSRKKCFRKSACFFFWGAGIPPSSFRTSSSMICP